MKKNYKKLLTIGLGLSISASVSAQIINESFNSVATLTTTGWAMKNLSTPIGTIPTWIQGVAGNFISNSGGDTAYVAAHYNSVAGAGTISNWLMTPSRTFNNGDIVSFYTRTVGSPVAADRMQFRMSLNGTSTNVGATNTSVGDFTITLQDINSTQSLTGFPVAWTKYTYTVSGLSSATAGRFAFRYYVTNGGPSGSNSDFIGVDDFVYTPFASISADVTVKKNPMPYTIVPLAQVAPIALTTTITNIGTAATTDAVLKAEVFQLPNVTTAIQTATSAATSVAVNASISFTVGSFTPTTMGSYLVKYTSSCTGNVINSLDTTSYVFTVGNNEYAKDDGNITGRYGIGAGPVGYIGSMFKINTITKLDSVLIALRKPGSDNALADAIGDSIKVVVFNVSAGLPNTIIARSAKYVFTAVDTLGTVVKVHKINAVGGGILTLTPGDYFVAVAEHKTNMGLSVTNDVFKTNTCFASWATQTWTPTETFGVTFAKTPVIRPLFLDCTGQPIITATTSNSLLCIGQPANLTAMGAISYTWNTSATGSVIAVSPSVTTTYTVGGMNASGCLNYTTVTQDVQVCTSLDALTQQAVGVLAVYPNPTKDFVKTYYKALNGEKVTIQITNAIGQVLISDTSNSQNLTFNISQLLTGMYFVNVIENNLVVQTQKLIKN